MTQTQRLFLAATVVLIPVLLTGLARARLWRLCIAFPLYLGAVWLGDVAWLLWPSRFYNWNTFVAKETLYGALKLAIALELAALVFGRFPGAATTARRALLTGLGLTLLALALGGPIEHPGVVGVALALQPRMANGTALLLLTIWVLVLWYHVPVHRLHRAILRGLVPYLLVFTVALQLLASWGWDLRPQMSYADAGAYVLLLLYWTWETWRKAHDAAPARAVEPLLAWRDRLGPPSSP